MTIKFNKTKEFENAKKEFSNAMQNSEMTKEEKQEKIDNYVESLSVTISDSAIEMAQNNLNDQQILSSRGQAPLTSKELKFFNAVVEDGLFNDEEVLPVTTIERVFDDLKKEHALLAAIGVQNLGPVTKMIKADPEGLAVWGKIFDGIQGQVNAAIKDEEFIQLKLTAFGVIPDDMLELGPVWVERYMRTLLVEVLSTGLEQGYLNGRGPNQSEPIGLIRNVNAEGNVVAKPSSGTLSLVDSARGAIIKNSLKDAVTKLSFYEHTTAQGETETRYRKVDGRVALVVNPVDAIEIQAAATHQNVNGAYVTALPFNVQLIESDEMEAGKALFFIKGKYLAAVGGGYKLRKFDQTLAMEDAHLYTIKTFAYGLPDDNNVAAIYDLSFDAPEVETVPAG